MDADTLLLQESTGVENGEKGDNRENPGEPGSSKKAVVVRQDSEVDRQTALRANGADHPPAPIDKANHGTPAASPGDAHKPSIAPDEGKCLSPVAPINGIAKSLSTASKEKVMVTCEQIDDDTMGDPNKGVDQFPGAIHGANRVASAGSEEDAYKRPVAPGKDAPIASVAPIKSSSSPSSTGGKDGADDDTIVDTPANGANHAQGAIPEVIRENSAAPSENVSLSPVASIKSTRNSFGEDAAMSPPATCKPAEADKSPSSISSTRDKLTTKSSSAGTRNTRSSVDAPKSATISMPPPATHESAEAAKATINDTDTPPVTSQSLALRRSSRKRTAPVAPPSSSAPTKKSRRLS